MRRPTLLLLVCLLRWAAAKPQLWSRAVANPHRAGGRVIGGTDADISNYPWQLSFEYSGSHICGASIISDSWVLTSAHCVGGRRFTLLSFRAGTTTRGSGGTVHQGSSGMVHGSYNSLTLDYDIALVQVSDSLLGTNAQAVGLPSDGYVPPTGLDVTVTGWGSSDTGGPLLDTLQELNVSIVNWATCREIYWGNNMVTERMVCAGGSSGNVCSGDYGGPMVSNNTLVGIASWGSTRCEEAPGVFTNVGMLRYWIGALTGF